MKLENIDKGNSFDWEKLPEITQSTEILNIRKILLM